LLNEVFNHLKISGLLVFILLLLTLFVNAQEEKPANKPIDSSKEKDLMDVIKGVLNSKPKNDTTKKTSTVTVLPAIGYNPSIGFLLGINFLRSFRKGDPATTNLSIAQLDVSVTTKKLLIARFRTNIFTADNKWNFQGNWQYMRNYVNDFGLRDEAQKKPPVNYPIRFNYFRFTEKAFRSLGNNFYAGGALICETIYKTKSLTVLQQRRIIGIALPTGLIPIHIL
jgi:hypothetical protein